MRGKVIPATLVAALAAAFTLAVSPLTGCVEQRLPPEVRTHPPEWNEPASADFHGARVEARTASECTGCHISGDQAPANVPGCDACHDGAGGHPYGWARLTSPEFHGARVAAEGPAPCMTCHGGDDGGWSGVSCSACHAGGAGGHPDGWMTPGGASFHGERVRIYGFGDCQRCHGFGLSGGTSGRACGECHS